MSIYNIVLFVHVIGAIGYFLGMGILLFILLGLRQAQRVEHVRALIHLNELSAPVSAASALLLLVLVFLMTTKPDLVGSLIVMVVALLLGLAAGVLISRMRRVPEPRMVDQRAQDKASAG